jgi:hypothetical protein
LEGHPQWRAERAAGDAASGGHHDLIDLPPDLSAELGPMLQRVERAILDLGGIARVHVNR